MQSAHARGSMTVVNTDVRNKIAEANINLKLVRHTKPTTNETKDIWLFEEKWWRTRVRSIAKLFGEISTANQQDQQQYPVLLGKTNAVEDNQFYFYERMVSQ